MVCPKIFFNFFQNIFFFSNKVFVGLLQNYVKAVLSEQQHQLFPVFEIIRNKLQELGKDLVVNVKHDKIIFTNLLGDPLDTPKLDNVLVEKVVKGSCEISRDLWYVNLYVSSGLNEARNSLCDSLLV